MLYLILLFFPFLFQSNSLFIQKSNGTFEAKVDWTCASDSIQVLVHTRHPFHGIIHPSGFQSKMPSSSCATRGNGSLTTRLQIALNGDDSAWDDCGLRMDSVTSTLWTLLEVHEHPLVMLNQDRTVNISCTDWAQSPQIDSSHSVAADHQSEFRLAIVSSLHDDNGPQPNDILFVGTEYNLSIQAVQPLAWPSIFVHSCSAISADKQTKLQLIDSDGCSMDQRLISDFEQPNRMLVSSYSTAPPLIFPSTPKVPSTQNNWTTITQQKLPRTRITVATAKMPQMFLFNTQSDQRRLNSGNVIHFECTVERCHGTAAADGGTSSDAVAPCPRTNCDRKRTIAEKQQQSEETTTPSSLSAEHVLVDEVTENGEKKMPTDELELVTQLLRAQQEEEGGLGAELEQSSERAQIVKATTQMPDDVEEDGAEIEAGPAPEQSVVVQQNGTTIIGEVKQQQLQLVQRRQKQLQVVRNAVRVFETQRNGVRDGSIAVKVPMPSDSTGSAEQLRLDITTPQPNSTPQLHTDFVHQYQTTNDLTEFVISSTESVMSLPNSSGLTNSTLSAAVPGGSTTPQQHQCVSVEQLSRLYLLGMALCALFLLGCLFNLFMCCFSSRRPTNAAATAGAKLKSPFRTKRGRRQPQQQKSFAVGHSSHTTLTSSLYGGGAGIETKNGNGAKGQQQVGFWINEDGQRNGGGGTIAEYAPMVSSFYEGVPNVTATDTSNNVVPQRRLSVHSYASVKQRGASQLFCKMPMPSNNGRTTTTTAGQQHQQLNQQMSMSPSSYSPSTTASSSTSGGGVGPPLLDNINGGHQLQQQQYPPLPPHATTISRSTFHAPVDGDQHQLQQLSNSSVASSVRSSATLDGGGGGAPSCSQSTVDDETDEHADECPTPRHTAIDFGTVQYHQQQYSNNMGGVNKSSTFRCSPAVTSNTMMMMGNSGNHHNESFSIL